MDKYIEKELFKQGITFDIDLYNTYIGLGFAIGNVIACEREYGFAFEIEEPYKDNKGRTQYRLYRYYYTAEIDNVVVVRYRKSISRFEIIMQPRSDKCNIFLATPINFPLKIMSERDYLIQFAKSYEFSSNTKDAIYVLETIGHKCAKGINDFADANSLFCFTYKHNKQFQIVFKNNRYDYDTNVSRQPRTVEPFQIFKLADHVIEYEDEDGEKHQFPGCRISFDIDFALLLIVKYVN